MASKIKISNNPAQPKATYIRKSIFSTTGDNSFRFNFDVQPEQTDLSDSVESKDSAVNDTESVSESKNNIGSNKQDSVTQDNSKTFKFKFSNTQFKFNFNTDNS